MVSKIRVELPTNLKEEVQPQSPLDPISPWPPPLPLETAKDEELSSKEIYGLIAVLGTYLSFGIYLVWALCPSTWLDAIGWTWYPSRYVPGARGTMTDGRDWAVIVPSYLMVVVLLAYWSYAALTPLLSPRFDSPDLIVGGSALSRCRSRAHIQISTLLFRPPNPSDITGNSPIQTPSQKLLTYQST
jgi:phosphatidylinositol glycan class P protein